MQLIINNSTPIDVMLEDIRIDYQVIDARTFDTERKNATTHEITLKATDAIRLAFGFPEMISSADAIRLSKNVPAMLVSDVTVIVGRVRFDKVKVVGREVFYQFYIVADNGVWVNNLNEKHLFELNWYVHDHILNSENQVNSEIPNSYRPYLYPIIDNDNLGVFYVHNTNTFTSGGSGGSNKTEFHIKGDMFTSDFTSKTISLFGFNESSYNVENISSYTIDLDFDGNGTNRIRCNTIDFKVAGDYGYIKLNTNDVRLRPTDRYPLINVAWLIREIFLANGYQTQGEYLDRFLTRKYIAYNYFGGFQSQLRFLDLMRFSATINEDAIITYDGTSPFKDYKIPFNDTNFRENTDRLGFFNTQFSQWQPKIQFKQTFNLSVRFVVEEATFLQFIIIQELENGATQILNGIAGTTYPIGTNEAVTTTFVTTDVLNTSKIYAVVRFYSASSAAQKQVRFLRGQCVFSNKPIFTPKSVNDTVHLIQYVPNLTQLQFVTSVLKAFQLIVETDVINKTVTIESYDNYYNETVYPEFTKNLESYLIFNGVSSYGVNTYLPTNITSLNGLTISFGAKRKEIVNTGAKMIFCLRSSQNELIQFFLSSTTGCTLQLRGADLNLYGITASDIDTTTKRSYKISVDFTNKKLALLIDGVLISIINVPLLTTISANQLTIGALFNDTNYTGFLDGDIYDLTIDKRYYTDFATNERQVFRLNEGIGNAAYSKNSSIALTNVNWFNVEQVQNHAFVSKLDAINGFELEELNDNESHGTIYNYQDDSSDIDLQRLKNVFNIGYGSDTVINNNQFKGTDYAQITLDFAPTYMTPANALKITELTFAKIQTTNFGDSHTLRLLSYDGRQNLASESYYQEGDVFNYVPLAFFYREDAENLHNLDFQDRTNSIGLLRQNHLPFIEQKQNARLLRGFFLINDAFVANFSNINKGLLPVRTNSEITLFRLNKVIQYNAGVQKQLTEIELIEYVQKRQLPTYALPYLVFDNFMVIDYDFITNEISFSIDCTNLGLADADVVVSFRFQGISDTSTQTVLIGGSETLPTTNLELDRTPAVNTYLPIDLGGDFIKRLYFKINSFRGAFVNQVLSDVFGLRWLKLAGQTVLIVNEFLLWIRRVQNGDIVTQTATTFNLTTELGVSVWAGDEVDYDAVTAIDLQNKFISVDFVSGFFNQFDNLEDLFLNNNLIKTIDLAGLVFLQNVHLNNNRLNVLENYKVLKQLNDNAMEDGIIRISDYGSLLTANCFQFSSGVNATFANFTVNADFVATYVIEIFNTTSNQVILKDSATALGVYKESIANGNRIAFNFGGSTIKTINTLAEGWCRLDIGYTHSSGVWSVSVNGVSQSFLGGTNVLNINGRIFNSITNTSNQFTGKIAELSISGFSYWKFVESANRLVFDTLNSNNLTIAGGVVNWQLVDNVNVLNYPNLEGYSIGRNLFLWSNDFTRAVWGRVATSISTGFTSYDGTNTASKLIPSTANADHYLHSTSGSVVGTTYALSIVAKADGYSNLEYGGLGLTVSGFSPRFNLSNGTMYGVHPAGSQMIDLGNGWYRCSIVFSATATAGVVYRILNNTTNATVYAGDGVGGILIAEAQWEISNTPTPYQETLSTNNVGAIIPKRIAANTDVLGNPLEFAAGALPYPDATIIADGEEAEADLIANGNTVTRS